MCPHRWFSPLPSHFLIDERLLVAPTLPSKNLISCPIASRKAAGGLFEGLAILKPR